MSRRSGGQETWFRLRDWQKGQADSERLAAQILRLDGFSAIDPSHPLGGSDGVKDIVCARDGKKWIGAAYFPRGQQSFAEAKKKFLSDIRGVKLNDATGLAFVTNQELRLSERKSLRDIGETSAELYHLERVASLLDSPTGYGVRLEFLDIEMSKDEQLAFHSTTILEIGELRSLLQQILGALHDQVPVEQLSQFEQILTRITAGSGFGVSFINAGWASSGGPISLLRVPLDELRKYKELLEEMCRSEYSFGSSLILRNPNVGSSPLDRLRVPLEELREFKKLLNEVTQETVGLIAIRNPQLAHLDSLFVRLLEYEQALDRVTVKHQQLKVQ